MGLLDKGYALARAIRGNGSDSFFAPIAEAEGCLKARGPYAEAFLRHDGRAVDKWLHYLAAYDDELGGFRNGFTSHREEPRPVRMLEIGVQHGGSLEMWRKFLGPEAIIWGIDVDPRCANVSGQDTHVRIGSQADPKFLSDVVTEMGGIDIVLDDGSHLASHQTVAFRTLFPMLSDGGLYAVEDLHTSYWRDYGGGYRRSGSFVENAKGMIDDMHRTYHRRRLRADTSRHISKITFYDSMVFIKKDSLGSPKRTVVGRRSF